MRPAGNVPQYALGSIHRRESNHGTKVEPETAQSIDLSTLS